MKTAKKAVLIVCATVLAVIVSLAGVLLYYYTHPASVKDLVETSLSRVTQTSVAIGHLSYTLNPLRISAKGMVLSPPRGGDQFHLEVPEFHAECSLEGPFGHKTLVVERLEIEGLSCRVSHGTSLPETVQTPQASSLVSGFLKRAFGFLIFRGIRLEGASVSDSNLTIELKDQTLLVQKIQAGLTADHRVEIACGIGFDWLSRDVNLDIPTVRIKTDKAVSLVNPEIGGSVTLKDAVFSTSGAEFRKVEADADLRYQLEKGLLAVDHMRVMLTEADIRMDGQKDTVPLDLEIAADGDFAMKTGAFRARSVKLAMGPRLQLAAELEGSLGIRPSMDLKEVDCRFSPRDVLPLLPSGIRKELPPVELGGPVHLTGRLKVMKEMASWAWDTDLNVGFEQNPFSFSSESFGASGMVSGNIRALGPARDLEISGDINVADTLVSGIGIDVEPLRAAVAFSGSYPLFQLNALSARIPRASARFRDKPIKATAIQLQAQQGQVNAAGRTVSLPQVQVDSSLLKHLTASLTVQDRTIHIVLQGKETGLLDLPAALSIFPKGWQLAGRDALEATVQIDRDNRVSVRSQVAIEDLSFQDPGAVYMGEKLTLKAAISGNADLSNHALSADLTMDMDEGEVLLDRFYVNLKNHPLSFLLEGRYEMKEERVQLAQIELDLRDVVTCRLNGRILGKLTDPRLELDAEIPSTPVKPLFSLFVMEPFQAERPLLRTMDVGGRMSARVNLDGTRSQWTARGRLQWHDGGMTLKDKGVNLNGIDLTLPVWLHNHDGKSTMHERKGDLSIASVQFPFVPEQRLAVSLQAGPNELTVPSSTRIQIPGGEVKVGAITITGLDSASPTVRTRLAIDGIRVGPLLKDVWPRPIEGTVHGRLDPVHFEGGGLTSRGTLTADLFGGQVLISNPSVSGLLTGPPVFRLDARFHDLDLSKLTEDTSFGKIQGMLRGYAKHLEVAQGQLQGFDLLLETIEKEGVPQQISVKAVDNIAHIGGGQSPFVGMAGMFASVFKEFPYKKIGVHATLQNDVFRINGTIREGDTEYLVKRGLLSGVNVVNQNPDNRASFNDMIQRIKRVSASKSGPVVK